MYDFSNLKKDKYLYKYYHSSLKLMDKMYERKTYFPMGSLYYTTITNRYILPNMDYNCMNYRSQLLPINATCIVYYHQIAIWIDIIDVRIKIFEKTDRHGGKSYDTIIDGIYRPQGTIYLTADYVDNVISLAERYNAGEKQPIDQPGVCNKETKQIFLQIRLLYLISLLLIVIKTIIVF